MHFEWAYALAVPATTKVPPGSMGFYRRGGNRDIIDKEYPIIKLMIKITMGQDLSRPIVIFYWPG
jgi:hypothetical protein